MKSILSILLFGAILLASCQKDDAPVRQPLNLNAELDTNGMSANTALEDALNRRISTLTGKMKAGRLGQQVLESELLALWQGGSGDSVPGNRAVAPLKSRYPFWLSELSKSSGNSWTPGVTTGEGGVYGSGSSAYLFDENGVEMEQMVEKSQFAGTQFRLALELLSTPSIARVQKAVVLFGAPASFPNSDKVSTPDRFSAAYAARRDKNDGQGLYTRIKRNFLELQAAAKAGAAYDAEYQAALNSLKANWEKALMATVINYCYSATSALSVANPGADASARALHAIGEAIGFTLGMKAIPAADRIITDAQIDAILSLLNAPFNGNATVYKFATNAFQELPKLDDNQGAVGLLKSIYGFSQADLTDFRQNWVNVQNR